MAESRHQDGGGNKVDTSTIDPFVVEIEVPFTKDGAPQKLTVIYQYAKAATGYVISVTDTTNAATAGGADMFAARKGEGPPPGSPASAKYPMDHDEKDNSNIADMTSNPSGKKEDEAKSIDAYTKIAGEGARWICVRNHASAIQNDTLFFIPVPGDATRVYGIRFAVLWRRWDTGFQKAYNIPDAKVAATLVDGGALSADRETVSVTDLKGKDYDLSTGRAYAPAAH